MTTSPQVFGQHIRTMKTPVRLLLFLGLPFLAVALRASSGPAATESDDPALVNSEFGVRGHVRALKRRDMSRR